MERNFKCSLVEIICHHLLNSRPTKRPSLISARTRFLICMIFFDTLQAWMLFCVFTVCCFQLRPLLFSCSQPLRVTGKMCAQLRKSMLLSLLKKDRTSVVCCSCQGIYTCVSGKPSPCSSSTSGRKKDSNCK